MNVHDGGRVALNESMEFGAADIQSLQEGLVMRQGFSV